MDTMTIPRNYVQEVRQANNWTCEAMAEEINSRIGGRIISHMTLNLWERGVGKPRLLLLLTLKTAGEPFASMATGLMSEHYPGQPVVE